MTEAEKQHDAAEPSPTPETVDPVAPVEDVAHPVDAEATAEDHAAETVEPAEAAVAVAPEPAAAEPEHVEPVVAAPQPEPAPYPAPQPVTIPAAAAVGTAAAPGASSSGEGDGRRPVWSDQGDAPDHSDDEPPARPRKGGGGGSGDEFIEILKTVVFALLIAVVLRILLFQPFTIPSASMEPNLYEGDYIVVSKWTYGYSRHAIPWSPPLFEGRIMGSAPKRGDVAVFKLPSDDTTDYIKRVIGLPGDRVQMIAGTLHINGQPVRDVVVSNEAVSDAFGSRPATQLRETLPEGRSFTIQDFGPGAMLDDTPVFEVPEGHYFMMGDNRDNSVDSRDQSSQGVGLVPEENLIGKAEIILFSWSPGASLFNPVSWFTKVRPSRFFTVLD